MRWSVVIPVKPLGRAKSRLARGVGTYRERLALAMAADTVTAAVTCPLVDTVVVVSDDSVATPLLSELGAHVVADEPDSGLNPALRHGAAVATATAPGRGVAALSADLPALQPDELAYALHEAVVHKTAFVADAAGVGTTLYTAATKSSGSSFTPAFGSDSRAAHRRGGAHELSLHNVDGLRRDVDTLTDLDQAIHLGVGQHTSAVVALLPRPTA